MVRVYHPITIEDLLDAGQLQQLARSLANVAANGYGEVTIVVDKGRPAFVRTMVSQRLEPEVAL